MSPSPLGRQSLVPSVEAVKTTFVVFTFLIEGHEHMILKEPDKDSQHAENERVKRQKELEFLMTPLNQ